MTNSAPCAPPALQLRRATPQDLPAIGRVLTAYKREMAVGGLEHLGLDIRHYDTDGNLLVEVESLLTPPSRVHAAIQLYERAGFQDTPPHGGEEFSHTDVRRVARHMTLALEGDDR